MEARPEKAMQTCLPVDRFIAMRDRREEPLVVRSASAMALRHLAKPLPRGLSEVLWSPRSVPEMNARASEPPAGTPTLTWAIAAARSASVGCTLPTASVSAL